MIGVGVGVEGAEGPKIKTINDPLCVESYPSTATIRLSPAASVIWTE